MKNYFKHLLKKNLLPLACLTLFCLVLYVIPISTTSYSYWNDYYPTDSYPYYYEPSLYYSTITVALALLSVFVPIYIFSYKMNRRSVDMYYSLPVSKTKILAVHFLVGLILMYGSYSIAYLLGFILIAAKVRRLYLIYYLCLYLASIVPAFITYAVTAFIYTRANTVIDGIISVAGALCFMAMVVSTLYCLFDYFPWYISGITGSWFFTFTPLVQVASVFGKAIKFGSVQLWFTTNNAYQLGGEISALVGGILWMLIAASATAGLFLAEKNSKAENCGQISDSIFCYRVQIPAYLAMFTLVAWEASSNIVLLCAIAFGAFVLSIIYKRSIKIGWKFLIVLGACIIGGVGVCVITDAIYAACYPPVW